MQGFEKYKMRIQASGGNLRQERINIVKNIIDKSFADDPSFYSNVVVFGKDSINCRIYDLNSSTKRNGVMRCMTEYDYPLFKGDLVYWQESWWICTHQQNQHNMYWNGVIEKTNHLLKWKNSEGKIIERSCQVLDNTKYTLGEREEDFEVILPDTRRLILIPYDEETSKINEDDRFFIDKQVDNPKIYRITSIDRISDIYEVDGKINGIIRMICLADLFNPQLDNKDLMIADYYTTTIAYHLELLNHDQSIPLLMNIGDTFQLQVLATRNGETCDQCEILYHSDDESIVIVDTDGLIHAVANGTCEIMIGLGTEAIILTIEVQASGVVDAYTISIVDSDNDTEILFGEENEVIIKTYMNGIEDNIITFEYELLNASGIALIKKVDGNKITIATVDSSKNINKTFSLRVWNEVLGIEDIKIFKVVGF